MSKHESPLISVVMPMYNSEKYVGEAIESVIRQTYPHWELLVVDDGSKDNSCEIVRSYVEKDPRIVLLINDNPVGMPYAPRNYGIKHAKGDYIAFLDSDDIWLREKLRQQLVVFHRDERTAVVYSDYEKIDENGVRSARLVTAPRKTNYKRLLYGNIIGNLTGIYDVRKVGKNYFTNVHHEDYAFWLSVLKSGYIARGTSTVTALYRVRNSSVSGNKLRVMAWQWHIYRRVENIGILRSIYYFCNYAVSGLRKALI